MRGNVASLLFGKPPNPRRGQARKGDKPSKGKVVTEKERNDEGQMTKVMGGRNTRYSITLPKERAA